MNIPKAYSRSALTQPVAALCDAFASGAPIPDLLSHFTTTPLPIVQEHGLPALAPFLGRTFTGTDGVGRYFGLIADLLTIEDMSFDEEEEWIVDAMAMAVGVRGRARFIWKETGEGWDETFYYRIGLAEEMGDSDNHNSNHSSRSTGVGAKGLKVQEYRVWADTGAAYLARMNRLGEVEREFGGKETRSSMERRRSGHENVIGEGLKAYEGRG